MRSDPTFNLRSAVNPVPHSKSRRKYMGPIMSLCVSSPIIYAQSSLCISGNIHSSGAVSPQLTLTFRHTKPSFITVVLDVLCGVAAVPLTLYATIRSTLWAFVQLNMRSLIASVTVYHYCSGRGTFPISRGTNL